MALSLTEILAAKRKEKLEQKDIEVEVSDEPEISYLYTGKAIRVDPRLFLAVYTPLIQNPYRMVGHADILGFREYREFILGEDQYILNTFYQLDIDSLLQAYLIYHPLRQAKNLYALHMVLSELHLCVPGFYQDDILFLIKGLKGRKNF